MPPKNTCQMIYEWKYVIDDYIPFSIENNILIHPAAYHAGTTLILIIKS
jgi:hypothetical protein